MHKLFRNLYLNTASVLFAPPDPPKDGDNGGNDNQDQGDGEQQSEGTPGEGEGQGGEGGGAEGEGGGEGEGEGEGGEGSEAGDGEDDELAGLTPEQREKVERRLARETGWRDRQIDRLHAKKRTAEGGLDAARTALEKAGTGADGKATDEQIRAAAQLLTAQERYDEACSNTDSNGRKAYKDKWSSATSKLAKMGGVSVDDMVAIVATDHPEVVLFTLSQRPDEYERIMALPPAKRTNEFVKIGLKEPPKAISTKESVRPGDVAKPVRPIQGSRQSGTNSRVNLYDDKVSDDDWYAERNKTRRKKFSDAQ